MFKLEAIIAIAILNNLLCMLMMMMMMALMIKLMRMMMIIMMMIVIGLLCLCVLKLPSIQEIQSHRPDAGIIRIPRGG